jgi:hypothetical protein
MVGRDDAILRLSGKLTAALMMSAPAASVKPPPNASHHEADGEDAGKSDEDRGSGEFQMSASEEMPKFR